MDKLFSEYKTAVLPVIDGIFAERKKPYGEISPWGVDAITKLNTFVKQGKLLRGGLVYLGANMYGKQNDDTILHIAAALEIMHSALLIHDDIIDNDTMRRYDMSIHKQYEQFAMSRHHRDAQHIGQSLGLCLGDLSFFIAWEILTACKYKNKELITQKIARELSFVGIAQMQDIHPYDDLLLDKKRILTMYQYKTGRYSISLPLIVGSLLADEPQKNISDLEELGTALGILFQIADDRLNIFGKKETTGKEIGSDIREGKNTLYRALLFQKASVGEKQKLSHIFGNPELTHADLLFVQLLIQKYAIDDNIQEICVSYEIIAQKHIDKLTVMKKYKIILEELLSFVQKRKQ